MPRVILHIDEEPRLPGGVAESLQREGYELLQTCDPEETMRLVEEREPALLLMEVELTGCDGMDLLRGVLAANGAAHELPVLILSRAARSTGLHAEAIALGVNDFLSKPALASELLASIRELAPPPPKVEEPAPAPAPPRPELEGDLTDAPLPELLARLRRRGATGVLIASDGRARVGVQLRNGSPVAVSSNRPLAPPGDEMSGLSEEAVESAIGRRAEAVLFEAFRWKRGGYQFVGGARLASDTALAMARDPESLLLAGVLEASPRDLVRDRLHKRASLHASAALASESPIDGVELTSAQEELLADLCGDRTLGEILESNAFEERLLYGLWVVGRLALHAAPILPLLEELSEEDDTALRDAVATDAAPLPPDAVATDAAPLPPDAVAPDAAPLPPDAVAPDAAPLPPDAVAPDAAPLPPDAVAPDAAPPPPDAVATDAAPPPPDLRTDPPPSRGELAVVPAPPAPRAPSPPEGGEMARALRELAQRVGSGDDFEVLDIPVFAPDVQVRAAYERILQEIPEAALTSPDAQLRERARWIRDRVEAAYEHLEDPETRRAYVLLRQEQEQDEREKPSADRALEAERWFRKGTGFLGSKRHDEAAEAFGMASHLDPDEGEYLSYLGYALYLSNPNQSVVQREAMEHIANGIKRSPDREMSYVYLGRILRARGETDAARKVFRRALRIKPSCHPALQEIRLLEMREKRSRGILSKLWRR